MEARERYTHQILSELESGVHSQRTLASGAGIALGLTNLLLRRFIRRGWVRAVRVRPNRVKYLLTPAGLAEKARMSRLFLQDSVKFYAGARQRISMSLSALSAEWPERDGAKRIHFYGAGEVAEIAYVCLQETDLELAGVISEVAGRRFFGIPVVTGDDIAAGSVVIPPDHRVVVATFDQHEVVQTRLAAIGVAPERVHWL